MRNRLWPTILVCVLVIILVTGCGGPASPADNAIFVTAVPTLDIGNSVTEIHTLRIGHMWTGEKLKVLESIVAEYQKQHPTLDVVLQGDYTNERILVDLPAGNAPDIFIARHDFGGQLFQQGLLPAYCAENQCPQCDEPNPPDWCWRATGNFGPITATLPDIAGPFSSGMGHCLEPCEVCQGPNPPVWCGFAGGGLVYPGLDLFEAAFADFSGDNPFPFGTPIDFSVDVVLANRDWFEERGLEEMPTTLEQLGSLVEEFQAELPIYYTDPVLMELMPSELKGVGIREQIEGAGIIVANSVALAHLDPGISRNLVPLGLKGLPPYIWVEGAYLNPSTELKSDALDFMYELSEPAVQEALFQQAGVLPVDSALLAKLADDSALGHVISLAATTGQLAVAVPSSVVGMGRDLTAVAPLTTTLQVSEDNPVVYQDIPPGFDFPADEATLLRFRDTQNVAEMRRHAWYVWAGLTQPARGGEAIWETWFSSTETFTPTVPLQDLEERNIQRNFSTPRQFLDMTGPTPQALGQSLLSFVLFNRTARAHIRGNNLHRQSTLTALNDQYTKSSTPPQDRRISDFPRDAVALKTVWWAVSGRASELTAMPVWDFAPSNLNSEGNDFPTWQRVVAIDPARDNVPVGESTMISLGNVAMPDSRVVPLSSFYHFRLETQEQVKALNNLFTANFSLGRDAEIGDYVALVALHYTTKEIPDWVWSTFWWHDEPNQGPYSTDRPTAVTGVWRNYLMDTSYDMVTPREFDGTPNAVYNPWLEARFSNGMSSNCMTCHQRSVWSGSAGSFVPVTKGGLSPDDPYFEDTLQLDFLWSIGFESK